MVCNFQEFQIYDMNRPNDEPETLRLANLEKEYHRLQFLVDTGSTVVKKEMSFAPLVPKLNRLMSPKDRPVRMEMTDVAIAMRNRMA